MVWYGSVRMRTPFTYDFICEWLLKASFKRVDRCAYRRTASAYPRIPHPTITEKRHDNATTSVLDH